MEKHHMMNVTTTPCSPPLGYLSHPSVSDYGFLAYKGDRNRILTPVSTEFTN